MLRRLNREKVYEGSILEFYRDTVELPDGGTALWDEVHHKKGGGACAVPVLPDGRILVIRQMRPVVGRETLELPAGARDGGESTDQTAYRELLEETGWKAGKMEYLLSVDSAPAWCDEATDIWLADELEYTGKQSLDEEESISAEMRSLDELLQMIFDGTIRDAKTAAGILAYYARIR